MDKTNNTGFDKLFDITVTVLLVVILLIVAYPLYFIIIASISGPDYVNTGKVMFYPIDIGFEGYSRIFQTSRIWNGYRNTILYTVFGTVFSVIVTLMAGYSFSRKDLVGRRPLMLIYIFTMYFGGGLIPTYLVVKSLHLTNNPMVIIILGLVSVYNMIITRSFFESSIPNELLEAAFMDGCSNQRFFFQIVLPLSKAVTAVITLYYAVAQWNGFFTALIYLSDQKYFPLQLVLRDILIASQSLQADFTDIDSIGLQQRIAESVKYGVIVVASLPVLAIYPFIQRYFIKGVMIGSIKG
ncbi:MAG: carbohydrate ABC transporter permease [Treponema sp.]|nr:carbohydrate ABC transporter permease [Treponema sp.]